MLWIQGPCRANIFLLFKQVWTQKCAVQKASVDVNISYYNVLTLKNKCHGHRGPGFFCKKTNPGLLFLLKVVRSCVFISNFHHSPPPPPKGYKIVSLIIN